MLTRRGLMAGAAALAGGLGMGAAAGTKGQGFTFPSIDGGDYRLDDWLGKPVLVVNTASMCGFTPQYADLQTLQDTLGDRGVVLAVPSDDFNQEYGTEAQVKEFCALNYNLTLPMTTIQHVAKDPVHPFFAWVKAETGFVPGWNFNKVLIGPDGAIAGSWGSMAGPMGEIKSAMETLVQASLQSPSQGRVIL